MMGAIFSVVAEVIMYIVVQVIVEGFAAILARLGIKPWVMIVIGLAILGAILWLALGGG